MSKLRCVDSIICAEDFEDSTKKKVKYLLSNVRVDCMVKKITIWIYWVK